MNLKLWSPERPVLAYRPTALLVGERAWLDDQRRRPGPLHRRNGIGRFSDLNDPL
jgi:hypothetical protein